VPQLVEGEEEGSEGEFGEIDGVLRGVAIEGEEGLGGVGEGNEVTPTYTWQVDLLCTIPFTGAVVGNLVLAWHSDKMGERKLHLIFALICASVGFVFTAETLSAPFALLFALTVTSAAQWSLSGPFWGLVNEFHPIDKEANVVTPLVNSIGNLGGVVGPFLIGAIRDHSKTYRPALVALALLSTSAAIPICCLPDQHHHRHHHGSSGDDDDDKKGRSSSKNSGSSSSGASSPGAGASPSSSAGLEEKGSESDEDSSLSILEDNKEGFVDEEEGRGEETRGLL
jgi:hypothetical protein